jgi:hypothetical protein
MSSEFDWKETATKIIENFSEKGIKIVPSNFVIKDGFFTVSFSERK